MSKYQLANSYYDTILKISIDTLNLRFRRIKRKHKNFASLIGFEFVNFCQCFLSEVRIAPLIFAVSLVCHTV